MYESTVRNLVLSRQCFTEKADRETYNDLFRLMSPVQPLYWTRPGSIPELVFRAGFMEHRHVFDMRSRRIIVKGRFQGGTVGYVFADELPLYAAVYSKKDRSLSLREIEIMELLETEGPMNIAMIKELTGWLSKEITPNLHKLQEKFLVYEDQVDDEWDRAWYSFEMEFPETDLDEISRPEAIKTLVMRFAYLNIFIDGNMINSFYRLKPVDISRAVSELTEEGRLAAVTIGQETGYARTEDIQLLKEEQHPPQTVFVLHRNDFLVKSYEYSLKTRFKHDEFNIIQYILIDGEFRGCTAGFFKNGPFIIEDVVLDLENSEAEQRKAEILEAVRMVNDPDESPVKRYRGKKL